MLTKPFTLFVILTIIGLVPFWVSDSSFVAASGMSDADTNPTESHERTSWANAETKLQESLVVSSNVPFSTKQSVDADFEGANSVVAADVVNSVAPAPNTHTAALRANLTITMSQSVSQTTVTPQTIPVHSRFNGQLDGSWSVGSNTITFDPDVSFHPGELVQTTVTTDMVAGGIPLEKPYVWQFRTGVTGGSGVFKDSGQSLGDSHSFAVALGDVDGDNDIDVVVGNSNTQASKVWLNDGTGTFSDSGQSLGTSFTRAIVLSDVDGDGDLDVFIANRSNQANEVWRNDGSGIFTDSGQSLGSSASYAAALADVDGDGDIDAFVANDDAQANKVWLNDGTGTFADSGQNLGDSNSRALALGDVDNDGDLDIFVGNRLSETNKVWLNNGIGTFTDSGQHLGNSNSVAIALGDVDHDGDLDAFVGNGSDQANKVWLNDGTGTFSDSGQSLGASNSYSVALGDLDGDGSLDAFVSNKDGQPNQVWQNDGTGNFSDSGQTLGNSESWAMALADLDNDGDLDAFVGNTENQPNKVWLNQNIIYVDINANGANDGTSWTDAYTNLQNALAAAEAGNEIWVAAGTYKPTSDSERTISFELKNGVALYGGFDGTETAREERNWEANVTILSGDLNGDDSLNVTHDEPTRAENSYHVVNGSHTDSSTYLSGFTITGGNANADFEGGLCTNFCGGGMYNRSGSPTVQNMIFSANSARTGGGMYNLTSSPNVSHVRFIGNSGGENGGGMRNSINSSPIVNDVIFKDNFAHLGGGMSNWNESSPLINNTTFMGNSASGGGGMYNQVNSSPTLSNVTFTGNKADIGGAMRNYDNSNPTISHVTFTGNLVTHDGGAIANTPDSSPQLTNSILWNNQDTNGRGATSQIFGGTPSVTYSLVQGGWITGTGNIDANPLFVSPINPNDAPTTAGDFHLQPNSPAIDAGDNDAVPLDITDLDGDNDTTEPLPFDLDGATRFLDGPIPDTGNGTAPIVDMGAYEQVFSVVINEVAWAGTEASADDEWIELYNKSPNAIDLTDWTLSISDSVVIPLTGVINGNDYYLLEREDDNTVSDIAADLIYTGELNDTGDILTLRDSSDQIVDTVNAAGGIWPAGSGEDTNFGTSLEFMSMERIERLGVDTDQNWATNDTIHRNGQDANGQPLNGTPKQPNSITFPEANDTCGGATEIEFDGNNQSPNYFDILRSHSDQDLFKFEVLEEYTTIKAELTEPADFELALYFECDDNQLSKLTSIGKAAWIIGDEDYVNLFNIGKQTGSYYLKVNAPNDSYSGQPYRLNVDLQKSNISDIETLIFYNHERFSDTFGIEAASQIMNELTVLAAHETVSGTIVQLDQYPEVQAAYEAWDAVPVDESLANVKAANEVAWAIRSVMLQHLNREHFPKTKYIVLVGNDRQIPFYRLDIKPYQEDTSWVGEDDYFLNNSQSTPLEAALTADHTLSDHIYGSLNAFNPFVPKFFVGRLVDNPERILAILDTYLQNEGEITLQTGAVVGYDFLADATQKQCDAYDEVGVDVNCQISQPVDLPEAFLTNNPDLVSHNWHANHQVLGGNGNTDLSALDILNAQIDLDGHFWSLIGCHAGLPLLGTGASTSLPQALSEQGVTFIGNTGWAWGAGEGVVDLSEKLYQRFTDQLTKQGASTTVGQALRWAKRKYYKSDYLNAEDDCESEGECNLYYHQKIMSEATLFGLPMLRVNFPVTTTTTLDSPPLNVTTVVAPPSLDGSMAADFTPLTVTLDGWAHQAITTTKGTFYIPLNGEPMAERALPLLPQQEYAEFDPTLGQGHGVIWLGGTYSQQNNNPVINTVADFNSELGNELNFNGLYPRRPALLTSAQSENEDEPPTNLLVFTTGQFEGNQDHGQLRLFSEMSFLVGTSTSDDFTPPSIDAGEAEMANGTLELNLSIYDESGIYKAFVTYTEVNTSTTSGVWQSSELLTSDGTFYTQQISYTAPITYVVQVMDNAGNVAIWPTETPAWDTIPPTITLPSDMTVQAADSEGANVTFDITVTDNFDTSPMLICLPASGGLFPIGKTTVNCTGTDLHGNSAQGSFEVTVLPPTTIIGSVTLQAGPPTPNIRWRVPLSVTLTTFGDLEPTYSFLIVTDQKGYFTMTHDIPTGLYEIGVKHNHTLRNKEVVTLGEEINFIDFGTLREGDANDDNFVTILDFSILATTFGTADIPEDDYDERADFNEDGYVNILDFSLLASHFGQGGDSRMALPSPTSEPPLDVTMRLAPTSISVLPGERFVVTIKVDAQEQMIDGTQAILKFEPERLKVEQLWAGSTLPMTLTQKIDHQEGIINFAAGALEDFPSGTIEVAQIEFTALTATDGTELAFQFVAPDEVSDVTFGGQSILGDHANGMVTIGEQQATAITVRELTTPTAKPFWIALGILVLGAIVLWGVRRDLPSSNLK